VMEYLIGGNLGDIIRQEFASLRGRRQSILREVAEALAYVHQKNVIHRDLCPRNVMFDRRGSTRLIDFGVAIGRHDRIRETDTRTGRPSYMAPEVIRFNTFDHLTDIYAFGVLAYEVMTGRRPFPGGTRVEKMNQHLSLPPPAPHTIVPGIDPKMEAILLRCLEKDRKRRFQSMADVIRMLAAVPEPEPDEAGAS